MKDKHYVDEHLITPDDAQPLPPDDLIREASRIAYEQDELQVIGRDDSGRWVIRGWEDPESDLLDHRVRVDATGVIGG